MKQRRREHLEQISRDYRQLIKESQATTENDVKNSVIQYLVMTGWLCLRINSGATGGEYTDRLGRTKKRFMRFVKWFCGGISDKEGDSGVSDIQAIKESWPPLIVETKRPGNVPTDAQRRFMDEWRKHGGLAIVANCVEDVIIELAEFSQRQYGT